jgi:hypothetical protein
MDLSSIQPIHVAVVIVGLVATWYFGLWGRPTRIEQAQVEHQVHENKYLLAPKIYKGAKRIKHHISEGGDIYLFVEGIREPLELPVVNGDIPFTVFHPLKNFSEWLTPGSQVYVYEQELDDATGRAVPRGYSSIALKKETEFMDNLRNEEAKEKAVKSRFEVESETAAKQSEFLEDLGKVTRPPAARS